MYVLVAILTTTIVGLPVVLLVDHRARSLLVAGASFLYGSLAVYAALLTLSVASIPWTAANTTATVLAISGACAAAVFARRGAREAVVLQHRIDARPAVIAAVGSRYAVVALLLDLVTTWAVAGYALYATIAPVWSWDFWAIWGLKARVFVERGGVDWPFLESRWNDFLHPDYPLLVPLNYAYAALVSGGWDDRWLGLYGVAYGIALLLIVRKLAADEAPPFVAAAITLAATAFALTGFVGLAEGAITATASAAILLARQGIAARDDIALRHAALLLGCAACSKNEGVALLVSVFLAMGILAPRKLVRLWPAIVLPAPWLLMRWAHHLSTDVVGGSWSARALSRVGETPSIVSSLVRHLADARIWTILAIATLLVALPLLRRERFVLLVTAVQAAFFVAVYYGTPWKDVDVHIATSWSRLTRQIAIPLLFVVMLALARLFGGGDDLVHDEARPDL